MAYRADRLRKAIAQDFSSQPSPAFQGDFGSGRKRQIHPIAGATFFFPKKADTLKLKLQSDQLIQPDTASDNVPAKNLRTAIPTPNCKQRS